MRAPKRRIVRHGPSIATGGTTAFTRDPSGSRASTSGLDRSTRKPSGATTRSIRWATVASSSDETGARQPAAALDPDARGRVDHHLGDRGIAEQRLEWTETGGARRHVADDGVELAGAEQRRLPPHELDDRGARRCRRTGPRAFEQLMVDPRLDIVGQGHAALRSARSSERGRRLVSKPGVDRPSDGCLDRDLGANRHTEHVFDVPRAECAPWFAHEHDTRRTQRGGERTTERDVARTNHEQRDRRRGGHRARCADGTDAAVRDDGAGVAEQERCEHIGTSGRVGRCRRHEATARGLARLRPRCGSARRRARSLQRRASRSDRDPRARACRARTGRRRRDRRGRAPPASAGERQRQGGGNHSGAAAAFGGPASDEHDEASLGTRNINARGVCVKLHERPCGAQVRSVGQPQTVRTFLAAMATRPTSTRSTRIFFMLTTLTLASVLERCL